MQCYAQGTAFTGQRLQPKGYARWTKQQLLSVLSKVRELFFKKHDLQQLNKNQLGAIVKENNIKVNLRKKKDEIIEGS